MMRHGDMGDDIKSQPAATVEEKEMTATAKQKTAEDELHDAMLATDDSTEASLKASQLATMQHPAERPLGKPPAPPKCRQRLAYHELMIEWYRQKLGEMQQ